MYNQKHIGQVTIGKIIKIQSAKKNVIVFFNMLGLVILELNFTVNSFILLFLKDMRWNIKYYDNSKKCNSSFYKAQLSSLSKPIMLLLCWNIRPSYSQK
jgi:hypothetical protein